MSKRDIIDILQGWGISPEEAVISSVLATVTINLKYPEINNLIAMTPDERKRRFKEIYKNQYLTLTKDVKFIRLEIIGSKVEPRRVKVEAALKTILQVLGKNYVGSLNIERIEGYIKKEKKVRKRNKFFTIKAKFGINIEGIEKGLQSWEERIILLKAMTYEDAQNKAMEILVKSDEPYLNSDKRFVCWKFEEILDIYETSVYTLNDFKEDGVEIYSKMYNRRLKS